MWQAQMLVSFLVMILLLCMESPLATVACTSVTPASNTHEFAHLQVMAVIPTNNAYESDQVQLPDWQKGEEILPGASIAAKEINDHTNLLSGHQLEVIPIRVPQCQLSEGIVPFVEELTSNDNVVGTVGYFCHNLVQYLSPLAHYWTAPVIQISATSLEDSCNDNHIAPHLQHTIASFLSVNQLPQLQCN